MRNLEELRQIAIGIQKLFGASCEVVIHDFTDLEHSIVHIEGNVTGRSIGGAATDLLLACVRNRNTGRDMYNYRTQLNNGRVIRSCTMFLRDENGEAYGAFCINFDITPFTLMHRYLEENFVETSTEGVKETFADDLQDTVHSILVETMNEMSAELPILTRSEKVKLIARLDEKGVFQVKKSVSILADELGLSRSTLYNYLSEARGERLSIGSQADNNPGDDEA
ncbi:MAG: PAS domain-containing protein [Anaerolineae bacterium]|nr:PAS domain-containing protein [Anaerolineae bacterium]